MPSNLTRFAFDAIIFEIAESLLLSDLPAQTFLFVLPQHAAQILTLARISGTHIFACSRAVAAIDPHFHIGKSDLRYTLLHLNLHATLACYYRIIITWEQLEHQIAVIA